MSYLSEWRGLIYERDPAAWIEKHILKNELNQPFALYPHQRDILRLMFDFDSDGVLPWDTMVWSCVKKSGKTSLLAILSLWWAMTQEPPNEIVLVANDMEQTLSRAYASIVRLLKYNPTIDPEVIITAKQIQLSNETTIRAIASEYSGAAGSNHGLVGFDELWAYTSERSQRLFEELTSVPTRRNSVKLIVTYAGFESESKLLRDIYLQGVDREEHPEGQAERLHAELPIYANLESRLCCYWDHAQGRFPWQTPRYYAAQKRTLRAAQYLRFHENRWSASAETFINPVLWDACTDPEHRPLLPTKAIPLYVGVDASLKHDSSAVVAVGFVERGGQEYIALAQHRIWHPSPDQPIDIEEDLERYLLELHGRYAVWKVFVDPWQLANTCQRLTKRGVRIEAYPQTVPNLTRSGQALFDLLNGQTLLLYKAPDVRAQALMTVAVESARGWRIAKEKSSHKIDSIVALSMACVAALESSTVHRFRPLGE
jgi:phage terminase large subunit-like protein